MAQSTTESYGTSSPTIVPYGMGAAPRYNYPEPVPTPYGKEFVPQPNPAWAAGPVAPVKRICGLRRPTFILVVLLIFVVIAAAVGGGVGGSIAVSNAYDRGKSEAATGTGGSDPTSTGDRVQAPPTEGVLALDCPGLTDTTHDVKIGTTTYSFRANCGINHPPSRGAKDLTVLPAYSFRDCITACAAFNDLAPVKDTKCVTAHFNANILKGGNCWLKSEVGDIQVNNDDSSKNLQIEGELLD